MIVQTFSNWQENRNGGIGGSDASALLGYNPYTNNIDLWKKKTNFIGYSNNIRKKIDKKLGLYGLNQEKQILKYFREKHKDLIVCHNKHNFNFANSEKQYIIGTFDGIVKEKNNLKNRSIIEFKTYNLNNKRKKWGNNIPMNYFIQVLHYLLVSNFEKAYLLVQYYYHTPEGIKTLEPVEYIIKKEDYENDLKFLKETEIDFWENYVLTKKMPKLKLKIFS